jgi:nucleotide-binding universal stress UspA family protein
MIKGILVGIDGSAFTASALELGIRWAKEFGALVVGIGVVDEPHIQRAEALPIGATYFKSQKGQAKLAQARHKVDQLLEHFAVRCADAGVPYTPLEDVGDPAERIELESQRYDVVLLGKETHFESDSQIAEDDTLLRVLRQGCRPVVSVPAQLTDTRRVLIAYDGSLQAARALQSFEASGLARERSIHVVTAAGTRLEAARIADRAVQFLSLHDRPAQPLALENTGQPADLILEQAHKLNVDLLVMGAYGRPSFREFFMGTVTRLVLKQSTVPVFVHH